MNSEENQDLIAKQSTSLSVAMRIGETPVPIPNTTVKTDTADGTAKVGE